MAKPRIAPRARGVVQTEGFAELAKQLDRLEGATAGRILEKAVLDAVEPIRRDMGRRAPRSAGPGGTRGVGHGADHIAKTVAGGSKPRIAEIHVGPEREYWHLVFAEFGTRYQPARPWGRPAVEAGRMRYIRDLRANVRAALRKAAR